MRAGAYRALELDRHGRRIALGLDLARYQGPGHALKDLVTS
jgi:hypothetical protein